MIQMSEFDWFDWLLNLVIAFYVGSFIWKFLKNYLWFAPLFDIEAGNQNELIHYVSIPKQQLEEVKHTYQWESYDEYDNRVTEYMELLFDNLTNKHREKHLSNQFWRELTRGQKVFWSFLAFSGDVENGGVYQFLHNKGEHLNAARQVMVELNQTELLKFYDNFMEEVKKNKLKLNWYLSLSQSPILGRKLRHRAYLNGLELLKSPEELNDYFYSDEFKKQWDKAMSDYIERSIEQFAIIT
jgi:hypothetical protein